EHRLRGQSLIPAKETRRDILRLHAAQRAVNAHRGAQPSRYRVEITTRRGLSQRIEVQPGLGERRAGTRLRYPSGEREAGRSWLIQLELLERTRAAHDLHGVCRALHRLIHTGSGGN